MKIVVCVCACARSRVCVCVCVCVRRSCASLFLSFLIFKEYPEMYATSALTVLTAALCASEPGFRRGEQSFRHFSFELLYIYNARCSYTVDILQIFTCMKYIWNGHVCSNRKSAEPDQQKIVLPFSVEKKIPRQFHLNLRETYIYTWWSNA